MLDSKYLEGMRELYLDSEKQFIEFSETVPYIDNSWYIHSPRLYSLLLAVCDQIESLMVKMFDNSFFILSRMGNIWLAVIFCGIYFVKNV